MGGRRIRCQGRVIAQAEQAGLASVAITSDARTLVGTLQCTSDLCLRPGGASLLASTRATRYRPACEYTDCEYAPRDGVSVLMGLLAFGGDAMAPPRIARDKKARIVRAFIASRTVRKPRLYVCGAARARKIQTRSLAVSQRSAM
jgi:hypothetical protein